RRRDAIALPAERLVVLIDEDELDERRRGRGDGDDGGGRTGVAARGAAAAGARAAATAAARLPTAAASAGDLIPGLLPTGRAQLSRARARYAGRRGVRHVDRRAAATDGDAAGRLEPERLGGVGEQRPTLAGHGLRRADLQRVRVHDHVR